MFVRYHKIVVRLHIDVLLLLKGGGTSLLVIFLLCRPYYFTTDRSLVELGEVTIEFDCFGQDTLIFFSFWCACRDFIISTDLKPREKLLFSDELGDRTYAKEGLL